MQIVWKIKISWRYSKRGQDNQAPHEVFLFIQLVLVKRSPLSKIKFHKTLKLNIIIKSVRLDKPRALQTQETKALCFHKSNQLQTYISLCTLLPHHIWHLTQRAYFQTFKKQTLFNLANFSSFCVELTLCLMKSYIYLLKLICNINILHV